MDRRFFSLRRFPRICELYEASKKEHPDNYFEHAANGIDEDELKYRFEAVEVTLQQLPPETWGALIKKAAKYVHVRQSVRSWQQLWDVLHEAKGFLLLQERGFTEIEFLPEGTRSMPDLKAKDSEVLVLLEVETVNVSDDECRRWLKAVQEDRELFRRIATNQAGDLETESLRYRAARPVGRGLPGSLTNKVRKTIEHALKQLQAHPQAANARRIILLVTHLDSDYCLDEENRAALRQFVLRQNDQYENVEIVHESVDWGWLA